MNKIGMEVKIDNSAYYFKLGNLLSEKNISKSKLCRETNTDYKVVTRLIKGNVVRVDIYVLAKLCEYLDCDISDIIEFRRNIYKKI